MSKLLTIHEAASLMGVSAQTLRRWEREGKAIPSIRTKGGQRRFNPQDIPNIRRSLKKRLTVAYARVSSHDQKEDLIRQEKMLEMFCSSHGWTYKLVSDLGSGMNYHKKGLRTILQLILNREIDRLVLTHKDRLLRFGSELIFSLCEENEVEVVLMNQGSELSFEEELAADVLEIITVFSARLYGARSRKNKHLIDNLKKAVDASRQGN
jgi:excisionase family DNA binding protein